MYFPAHFLGVHPSVNAELHRAVGKARTKSHPCPGGCGQYVSGSRAACLKCVVDGFVEAQAEQHPETPVERAAIVDFVLSNPQVNAR